MKIGGADCKNAQHVVGREDSTLTCELPQGTGANKLVVVTVDQRVSISKRVLSLLLTIVSGSRCMRGFRVLEVSWVSG